MASSRLTVASSPLVSPLKSTQLMQLSLAQPEEVEKSSGSFFDDDKNMNTEQKQKGQQPHPKEQQLYLFSLNWVHENDPEYFLKKDIRRLWEWKDTALGDGRDFFVPRPKMLMALQHYLIDNIPDLTECSIISNCARLEVICCCYCYPSSELRNPEVAEQNQEDLLARSITNCFVVQMDHYMNMSKNSNAWTKLMLPLQVNGDRPESILTTDAPKMSFCHSNYHDSWWDISIGPEAILPHICKISAGMGRRPRRPDRPVVFRPFSSRDAHILLQLKRTRENIGFHGNIIMEKKRSSDGIERREELSIRKRKLLPMILDCALRAGKAARNPVIVPEINELKDLTSAESSLNTVSERKTSERVAKAAYERGIEPLIKECLMKFNDSACNIDSQIAEFRQCAFEFLQEIEAIGKTSDCNVNIGDEKPVQQELRLWLNRRLHEPTIKLRSLSRKQSNEIRKENYSDHDPNKEIEAYISDTLKEIKIELAKSVMAKIEIGQK
eukprot:CAMPEP_0197193000 /NCGR_PEP_ID=MMETSP1423-20130617/26225_1 /TAXON_ID=476441 /ORGANISM="Pseudo-nitzschia heimii, Strain UNC1101" /LENGTH=496 /DNA_ID=CAMNT_0042646045 /DNA_START=118 /DNA_END=1608 /DNA_ORIENTATION=+